MKSFLLFLLICPFVLYSQTKPIGNSSVASKKNVAKKNPAVVKLVAIAYEQYQASKDDECKKTISQILALDAKNKDAFLLLANLSMFEEQYDDMWSHLNKIYKFYPQEPEVYSQFVMTHLNYFAMPDSIKVLLCRKTIRLASQMAEPFAALGMVAAVAGYYEESLSYFDISLTKKWKDSISKTIILLPYARCLYALGEIEEALVKVNQMIPHVKGNDKYTCLFLKARYMMDLNQLNVKEELDTLNAYSSDNPEILKLNASYYKLTNSMDTACKYAKSIRLTEGGETFDLSPYCNDIVKVIDFTNVKKMMYALGDEELNIFSIDSKFPNSINFGWEKQLTRSNKDFGNINIPFKILDSSYYQSISFTPNKMNGAKEGSTLWLSKAQFCEIEQFKATKISINNAPLSIFRVIGNEQLDVLDNKGKEFLLDCVILSDGKTIIGFINDIHNPIIVKIESENINLFLYKLE
ncbi:MAG: hypothetical protein Q8K70_09255 [Bacteroidota bacterium]|nr:hypothetical protein [Bacteroidota bacterium]